MTVRLNHTIVWCRDKRKSATFLTEILGRETPVRFGPFLIVEVDNAVSLDFHDTTGEIAP
jgi:catechol 2,3-dioxygenase-like lactoylglutathione lyase family enzyme